jgi:hypothetical protein
MLSTSKIAELFRNSGFRITINKISKEIFSSIDWHHIKRYCTSMNKAIIDTHFDFRNDTKRNDPDRDSRKLYKYHKLLWTKVLPCNKKLDLEIISHNGRLLLKNKLYGNFSSDKMFPHLAGKYNNKFDGWLTNSETNELRYIVRTIGGHIIFPAHKHNGNTINQVRGCNIHICDRFDLTLECLRLFYLNKKNPLSEVFLRYKGFFDLFGCFRGYVDFFLLQDFIDKNDNVKFVLPFDNFTRSALPVSPEEYKLLKDRSIALINKRNKRISKLNL